MTKHVYVSIDVEADGPIPGPYSMLSIGAAAFILGNRTPLSTFEMSLTPLEGAGQHPDTMAWWEKHPEAWQHATTNQVHPSQAMALFSEWLRSLPGKPTAVGYPITFDLMFVYWYLMRFNGHSPFGFQGICLKNMASQMLGLPFRETSKRRMPARWFEGCPKHTHKALDDAIGQGIMFINMTAECSDKRP